MSNEIVNEKEINEILEKTKNPSEADIKAVLKEAEKKQGMGLKEAGILVNSADSSKEDIFSLAKKIKFDIYGERLVFFAPIYASDFCVNDCEYCGFHDRNKIGRKKLTSEQTEEQAKFLINMGHKRILLEFGEDPKENPISFVTDTIDAVYKARTEKGNIRRVNVNIAATTVENYKKLKAANIGTYQLFQETYHRATFNKLHKGPKADYDRQLTAHDRAMEAGIDDRGIGVLFGLYDWKFEVLAILSHAIYMDKKHKVGPHTISVPRFCPAPSVKYKPEYPLSDAEFLKLIAILRLAVPYTGMIISTRENPEIRKVAFTIGISQTSAGSVTETGGYGKPSKPVCSKPVCSKPVCSKTVQFETRDNRSMQDIIKDALEVQLLPSFCTACYRRGRTGEHFMELAKPGEIHKFCRSNGILTFAEYLEDFADENIKKKGYEVINYYLSQITGGMKKITEEYLETVKLGKRDVYF